jgi:hypothetical protein
MRIFQVLKIPLQLVSDVTIVKNKHLPKMQSLFNGLNYYQSKFYIITDVIGIELQNIENEYLGKYVVYKTLADGCMILQQRYVNNNIDDEDIDFQVKMLNILNLRNTEFQIYNIFQNRIKVELKNELNDNVRNYNSLRMKPMVNISKKMDIMLLKFTMQDYEKIIKKSQDLRKKNNNNKDLESIIRNRPSIAKFNFFRKNKTPEKKIDKFRAEKLEKQLVARTNASINKENKQINMVLKNTNKINKTNEYTGVLKLSHYKCGIYRQRNDN